MDATFKVTFRGKIPGGHMQIGDRLKISGTVMVNWIGGELIDITSVGDGREYALGEVSIDALGELIEVEKS